MTPAEEQLVDRWAERDLRYADPRRRTFAGDPDAAAVRLWRAMEADEIGSPALAAMAKSWTPPAPEHSTGGGWPVHA